MSFDTKDIFILENLNIALGNNSTALATLTAAVNNGSSIAQTAASAAQVATDAAAVEVAATTNTQNSHINVHTISGYTSNVTTVSVPSSDTQLLAANPDRVGAIIYVTGSYPIFLKLGSGAAVNSYTMQIQPGSYFQIDFLGEIDACAPPTLTASVQVTELL